MSDWILLIDFGTSFSRAAVRHPDGRVEPIEVDGAQSSPSGIWADPAGTLSAGLAAQRQARLAPERWERAPKRSLGQPSLRLGSLDLEVPDAVATVLRLLSAKEIKRRGLPREVRLTCSATWDAAHRQALLAAAARAGLGPAGESAQLVDWPIAIGRYLAGHGRLAANGRVALFDLGGGGLDTAVIEATGPGIAVRSLGGIAGLGGEYFDDLIYREVTAQALTGWDAELAGRLWEPPDAAWRRAAEGLFREVRRAKEELSRQQVVSLDTGPLIDTALKLDRTQVESLLRPQILRSARELASTIELSGLRPRALDAVYLSGGGSRTPLVARAIFDVIGVRPILLEEPNFLAGAAGWTPEDQIDPAVTRITRSGRGIPAIEPGPAPALTLAPAGPGSARSGSLPPGRPPFWRRRWPQVVVAALILLLGGTALIGSARGSDNSDGRAAGAELPAATSTPSVSPSGLVTEGGGSLPAVTGLAARINRITVDLHWTRVRGAASYRVYRDPSTPLEAVKAAAGTHFGDRPGDGREHTYLVLAVDDAGRSGATGRSITASAQAPYGDEQDMASAWTAVVPIRPGQRGTAGQRCESEIATSDYSNGQLGCRFENGVRLTILRYVTQADRDRRGALLEAEPGVQGAGWDLPLHSGFRFTGRLLTASESAPAGPWLWWSFDAAPTYAMGAEWPGHTAKELAQWWRQIAPFRR